MARQATGELVELLDGRFAARITLWGKNRKEYVLPTCLTWTEARGRTTALADLAKQLRKAGLLSEIPTVLQLGANARAGRPWDALVADVDRLLTGGAKALGGAPTVSAFGEEWRSGKLHARYPDHVTLKHTEGDDNISRKYVDPVIGGIPIDEVTLDHVDDVMSGLPELRPGVPLSSSSRRHVAQYMRRLLALAVYPGRHIKASPIPPGWLPKVRCAQAFTYLYPAEDAKLMGCVDVLLVRRLFYGVLAREGFRREELASLRFRDLDLVHGSVALDVNKTADHRAWRLDPWVWRALVAWKKRFRADARPDDEIFGVGGVSLHVDKMADQLRKDLHTARADRPQLYERSASRRPIRIHDLRATFVTISLAIGMTEAWVSERTGHTTSRQINAYRRAARTHGELGLGPLLPLDEAIPELARDADEEAAE